MSSRRYQGSLLEHIDLISGYGITPNPSPAWLSRKGLLVVVTTWDVLLAAEPPDEDVSARAEPLGGRLADVITVGERGRVLFVANTISLFSLWRDFRADSSVSHKLSHPVIFVFFPISDTGLAGVQRTSPVAPSVFS